MKKQRIKKAAKKKEEKFRKGDAVMMVAGTYQGTTGIFLNYRTDKNWADIQENNGTVRHHPITWMEHVSA